VGVKVGRAVDVAVGGVVGVGEGTGFNVGVGIAVAVGTRVDVGVGVGIAVEVGVVPVSQATRSSVRAQVTGRKTSTISWKQALLEDCQ